MKPRLVRAIQRGGVAALIRADTWGVWRTRDRRGRMIGTITGADIDIMRLRDQLKPIGGDGEKTLAWGGEEGPEPQVTARLPDPEKGDALQNRSLLESLIVSSHDPAFRRDLRAACQNYIADVERASASSDRVTMNWNAFDAGDRVQSGFVRDPLQGAREALKANARLTKLHAELSSDDARFLRKMVLFEATRASLAKTFAMRPALTERHGLAVLRTLVEHDRSRAKSER